MWKSVVANYDLGEHELAVLRAAVATVDVIDALETQVASEGVIIDSPQGRKAHPGVVEGRQQRIALARLLSALRVPVGDENESAGRPGHNGRPQRRTGTRGVYAVGGRAS